MITNIQNSQLSSTQSIENPSGTNTQKLVLEPKPALEVQSKHVSGQPALRLLQKKSEFVPKTLGERSITTTKLPYTGDFLKNALGPAEKTDESFCKEALNFIRSSGLLKAAQAIYKEPNLQESHLVNAFLNARNQLCNFKLRAQKTSSEEDMKKAKLPLEREGQKALPDKLFSRKATQVSVPLKNFTLQNPKIIKNLTQELRLAGSKSQNILLSPEAITQKALEFYRQGIHRSSS